jgi:D-glycero-alpha-D-manno-heptose-7-phosphate kinase
MIITRTPYRFSFFGGGTDYEAWYENNGGLIIGTTFQQYSYISCRRLPPFFEHKTRVVYSKTELVKANHEIYHPAIRGCLGLLGIEEGLEIHHDGDLPARSGVGSSSSFTVGLLLALHGLRHEMLTNRQLADEAIKVEQEVLGEHVGIQDQILTTYGGLQVINIDSAGKYSVNPLILPPDYQAGLEQHVLFGYTGISRTASEFAGAQIRKIKNQKSRMDEIHAIAEEAQKLFQKRADYKKIGDLLHKSWLIKSKLADGVTNYEISTIYKKALKAGAYGGKIMGAGGGGFFMFFAPPEKHLRIQAALPNMKAWVPCKFEKGGAQVIFHQ